MSRSRYVLDFNFNTSLGKQSRIKFNVTSVNLFRKKHEFHIRVDKNLSIIVKLKNKRGEKEKKMNKNER